MVWLKSAALELICRVYALHLALVFESPGLASNVGRQAEMTTASTSIDPAVRAQQQSVHDVYVIARHKQLGYLLLLNKGAWGKEFKLPSGKFEHPGIGGDSYTTKQRALPPVVRCWSRLGWSLLRRASGGSCSLRKSKKSLETECFTKFDL